MIVVSSRRRDRLLGFAGEMKCLFAASDRLEDAQREMHSLVMVFFCCMVVPRMICFRSTRRLLHLKRALPISAKSLWPRSPLTVFHWFPLAFGMRMPKARGLEICRENVTLELTTSLFYGIAGIHSPFLSFNPIPWPQADMQRGH
jgi:hypothetical protein